MSFLHNYDTSPLCVPLILYNAIQTVPSVCVLTFDSMTKWYSKLNVFKAGLSSEDVNIVQEYEDEINFYYVNLST